jgi:hypothetical protein
MIKLRIKHWMLAIIVFTIIIATYFSNQISSKSLTNSSPSIPSALALLGEFKKKIKNKKTQK